MEETGMYIVSSNQGFEAMRDARSEEFKKEMALLYFEWPTRS
jgi:hypothetical protein